MPPAGVPRLLTRLHIRRVALFPVGRVCKYKPVELHRAIPLIAGGFPASAPTWVLMAPAATVCTQKSKSAISTTSPDPPAIEMDDQSAASGRTLKSLV